MRSFSLTINPSGVSVPYLLACNRHRVTDRGAARKHSSVLCAPSYVTSTFSAGRNEPPGLGHRKSLILAYLLVTFLTNEEGNPPREQLGSLWYLSSA